MDAIGTYGVEAGMLLNILQYTRHLPTTNNYPAQMSALLRLRNPVFSSAKNTAGRQSQMNRGTLKGSGEPLKDLNRRVSWSDGILCI